MPIYPPQTTHILPAPLLYTCQTRPVCSPRLVDVLSAGLCARQFTCTTLANSTTNKKMDTVIIALLKVNLIKAKQQQQQNNNKGQDFCLLCSQLLPVIYNRN